MSADSLQLQQTASLLISMGEDLRTRDPRRAAQCFAQAAELARAAGDGTSQVRALRMAATLQLQQGALSEAGARLESALALALASQDPLEAAACLNALGSLRLRQGNLDEGWSHLRRSLAITTAPGVSGEPSRESAAVRAETLELLGRLHREKGETSQALRYYEDVLGIRRAAGEEAGIAACLNHLGNLRHRMGRFEEAIADFREAIAVRRKLEDRRGAAATANNLAMALLSRGEFPEAGELLRESRRIFESLGEPASVASVLGNLGTVASFQGHLDEADRLYKEVLRLRREAGDRAAEAHALNNLSHLEGERGRPEAAIEYADTSLRIMRELGVEENVAKPLFNRARALLELGRIEEAAAAGAEALAAAEAAQSDESRADCGALVAQVLLARGSEEEAARAAAEAVTWAEKARDPVLLSACLAALADVQVERGAFEEAKTAIAAALRCLRGLGYPFHRGSILAVQGRLHGRAGSPEAGADFLRRAGREFERVGNVRRQLRALAEIEALPAPADPARAAEAGAAATELAREHDLEPFLATLRATRRYASSSGGPEADGPSASAAFVRLAEALLAATGRDEPEAEPVFSALRDYLRIAHGAGGAILELFPEAAQRWNRSAASGSGARVALGRVDDAGEPPRRFALESRGVPLGELLLPPASPGAPPAPERELGAAARLFALAFEALLDRLDRLAVVGTRDGELAGFESLVGTSRGMREIYLLLASVAPTASSVLLLGESGTGKELAARSIHARSPRRHGPFVAISCPSIPRELIESELFGHEKGAFTGAIAARPGKVEAADGGTLFLDEVGDMDLATQAKLLRFLEEREFQRVGGNQTRRVDVRLVAATSRDLTEAMRRGQFREDLYYRLNVVPVRLPSLRERREDIPLLVEHFLRALPRRDSGQPPRLSAAALDRLARYDWPGNVRELRNALEYMTAIAGEGILEERHVPEDIRRKAGREPAAAPAEGSLPLLRPGETLESRLLEIETSLIRAALDAERWNQSAAARRLGITETMIRNRMQRYGIRRPGAAGMEA